MVSFFHVVRGYSFLLVFLLLGMVGWLVWTQNELVGKIVTMENILSGMSSEWEGRLKEIEDRVANSDLWPKDASAAEQFAGKISDLVTGLPAWAEANYLPRLNLVRWAAGAFNLLNGSQNGILPNDLAMVEDMRRWADAKPPSDASDLDLRLREKATQVESRQVDKSIEWAEQYLKKGANAQQDSTEAERIVGFFQRHEKNLAQDDPKRAKKIAFLWRKLESGLQREFEKQQIKDWTAYQKWALGEIEAFRRKLQNAEKALELSNSLLSVKNLKERISGDSNGAGQDKRYKEIQDAMIRHLLPINMNLLDLPVLKLYHQEYDNGWMLLDERKERDEVVKKSVETPKRSLRDVKEGWAPLNAWEGAELSGGHLSP